MRSHVHCNGHGECLVGGNNFLSLVFCLYRDNLEREAFNDLRDFSLESIDYVVELYSCI